MGVGGKWMKIVKIAVLILVFFLYSAGFAAAQVGNDTDEKIVKTPPPPKKDCPSEEACTLWEEFKEKYGEKWRVSWNEHTGAPKTIFGYHYDTGMGEVADETKAKTIADDFISDNKELFKISVPDLKNQKVKRGNIGWVVTYEQYYNEVPVKYGRVLVAITNTSNIYLVDNNFYPDITISTAPEISEGEAIDIAKRGMDANGLVVEYANLEVLPYQSRDLVEYYLAWEIELFNVYSYAEKTYFIDAKNGEIIKELDTGSFATDMPAKGASVIKTWFLRNIHWIAGLAIGAFVITLVLWRRRK